ncbi:MAG: phosphoribosylamine--glycine ligase [Ignavibacterium sp.]|jgi:phosphoribosylamine--glycine ligase|nr:phosphoribosylamine--glycine ligase [Ignavibacterium sp.]
MNVLVIGSGGREHAIALKISESKKLKVLYCLPGNPGTDSCALNLTVDIKNHQAIINICKEKQIDLVIIGPEQPLVDGLSDQLRNEGIKVFGPSSNASRIESSKAFAKKIMSDASVPTANYIEFSSHQLQESLKYIETLNYPTVIKADGLAAGKGVLICQKKSDAETAIKEIFELKIFGDSGNKLIIEEFLEGEEASIFAITDGEKFLCLPAAQDHKRIGDGDIGKNTGGMGAYAPAPIITEELLGEIETKIIRPVLQQMEKTGNKFIGCLYAGLIITTSGPMVIEFNCRFGDPETQVVLPILEGDFLQLLYSASVGNLDINSVKYSGGSSVCIVAASNGYPDDYKKGFEINGLGLSDDEIIIYHAGTKKENTKIVTSSGRVLGVTSILKNQDLKLAKQKAYSAINQISFDGMYYRKDIADKAFKNLK